MDNVRDPPSYFRYWGKAKKDTDQAGVDYHLLPYHSLDVAAVGFYLFNEDNTLAQALSDFLQLPSETLQRLFAFCLAMHDLGKFSSAFQALYANESPNLIKTNSRMPYDGRNFRHDMLGGYFWRKMVQDDLVKIPSLDDISEKEHKNVFKSLMVILECTLGHHGKPIHHANLVELEQYVEKSNLDAASEFVQKIVDLLSPEISVEKFSDKEWRSRLEQVSWHLAGVSVLADWIGSDKNYFKYQSKNMDLAEYWSQTKAVALTALAATEVNHKIKVKPFESIHAH